MWKAHDMNILIVDDEAVMCSLITIILQRQGHTVVSTRHSFHALRYLETATPDAIILDIMMPEMDGISLCRRIRSNPKTRHIPVLMFSALGDEANIRSAISAGADRFLLKPRQPHDLSAIIDSTLREMTQPYPPTGTTWS
jgi:DNA-binding response OmpR family regulator